MTHYLDLDLNLFIIIGGTMGENLLPPKKNFFTKKRNQITFSNFIKIRNFNLDFCDNGRHMGDGMQMVW